MDLLSVTSRYAGVGRARLELSEEQTIVYLRRRFLPQDDQFAVIQMHTVK